MMFNVRLAETRSGGGINEDLVGAVGTAAWVIDGASGVGDNIVSAHSDARWFADRVDVELRALLTSDPAMPFADLFGAVVDRCQSAHASLARRAPEGRHELPSAAMAFVRTLPDRVELATLGDCQILFRRRGEDAVQEHGNGGNIASFEARTKALARAIMAEKPGISGPDLLGLLLPQLVENRAVMNVEGGYWVLGLQPEAIAHADRIELPPDDWGIAMASDGFLRLSDLFDRLERHAMLAIAAIDDFESWYAELRRLEHEDGSLVRYPRVKIADDASFLRIDVHTSG